MALLGWPVAHSLSPLMHNAAFREQDLDYVYVALPTPPTQLATVVDALDVVGAAGANVTVPHKQAVTGLCDRLTEEARQVGAVNTLVWEPRGLLGDNTDAVGLAEALRDDLVLPDGARVVVLGTGGAARAAAVALGRTAAAVAFVGRRPAAAVEVAALASRCGARRAQGVDLADTGAVRAAITRADLIINATPLGMEGEKLPAPFHALAPGQAAYDLVYNPPDTPFLVAARQAGAVAHPGLSMLVAQATASYRRWTGHAAPASTMSAVALAALTGR